METIHHELSSLLTPWRVQPYVTLWTVTHQTLLSMEFSWQEYWSGLPFPTLNSGIEPVSLGSPALAGIFFTTELPGNPQCLGLFTDFW